MKNIVLIEQPYSRKPFRSHSKEIIIFPRCYIYEVKGIYCARKEKLAKGHHCSRDHAMVQKRRIPVTISTCYSSNHRTPVLVDVLYALGLSLSYPGILDFKKYVSVSAIEFTDTLSEKESMKCFLQFIADNFDHNQDTTTGACTTNVMGLISSRYPKSDILSTQRIVKQTITSEINDLAHVRGLVKMYEKPSISKFKHALVDGYADTMIVQQALNEATKKNVVVHCIDTDVFIALLHYFYISGNSIVMTKKQGLCSIEKVVSALDDDLRQCY